MGIDSILIFLKSKKMINPNIEHSWKELLIDEFNKDYFFKLKQFLINEKANNKIYPPSNLIFNAFNKTPFNKIKVVIIGQDPYHGEGQAHGLCFSVQNGIKIPPSLVNIFKELKQEKEINFNIPKNGNLEKWAEQGVLLLNATLTVRANEAGSHQNKGWEIFTDNIIRLISAKKENIVFLLWGGFAKSKEKLISKNNHYILKSVHPSPLSANRGGWFGNNHFYLTNKFLISKNISPINWQI